MAALYARDRKKLYNFIHEVAVQEEIETTESSIPADPPIEEPRIIEAEESAIEITGEAMLPEVKKSPEPKLPPETEVETETSTIEPTPAKEEIAEPPKSVEEPQTSVRSFNAWLQHFPLEKSEEAKPIEALEEAEIQEVAPESDSIKPISPPPGKEEQDDEITEEELTAVADRVKKSITQDQKLVTETLAKIYVAQRKFSKAIDAYTELGLRNPSKSDYFAARIEELKNKI